MRSTAISFGIIPAPGKASVPSGRSPLMASTRNPNAASAAPAIWSERSVKGSSAFDLADGADSGFDAARIGGPERGEFGLVHVVELLSEPSECSFECVAMGGRVQRGPKMVHDVLRRAVRGKQADPVIIFDVIA